MTEKCRLVCSTGEIVAKIGDRFTDHSGGWQIVGFKSETMYSPSSLGGTPLVVLKPDGRMPSWFEKYANEDGTIDWCGDSVAAALLSKTDGEPRSSRGAILKH